jgi:integrase
MRVTTWRQCAEPSRAARRCTVPGRQGDLQGLAEGEECRAVGYGQESVHAAAKGDQVIHDCSNVATRRCSVSATSTWITRRQHGKLYKERVGPRALAVELYRKRKTEIREGRFFPKPIPKRVVLFDEIAEDFLTYSREHKRSAENDEARMRRLLETFAQRPVGDIRSHDVERLRGELSRNLSAASANRHLALLKVTFNRAMKAEPAKADRIPVRGVKLLKENNARVRVLTEAAEEHLLAVLPLHYRLLVIVALHTGMRRGELVNLGWQDVDFHTCTLVVGQSKSGEGRRVPMNQVAATTLRALRRERQAFGGWSSHHRKGGFCTTSGGRGRRRRGRPPRSPIFAFMTFGTPPRVVWSWPASTSTR